MIQIVPAILSKTAQDFARDIEKLNSSESFKDEGWVHIDFMDNKFVPNQSINPEETNIKTNLKKEAHLMVERPTEWIQKLKDSGFERVIFHIESKDAPQEVIDVIKDAGMEAGIAANPQSPLESLKQLKNLELILIMGVEPGFQGQPFVDSTYDRLTEASSFFENVAVDGGVKDENAKRLVQNGAKTLISGSFILNGNIDEQVEKIWESLNA